MPEPRVAILSPPYRPDVADDLRKWMPPDVAAEPLALFRMLVINPRLSSAMRTLGAHILGRRFSLDLRERELLIDRTCARCGAEYEWGVHVAAFGGKAGLTEEETIATAREIDAYAWSHRDVLLLRTVDALHDQAEISDDLWEALISEWSDAEILDIIATVGYYHLISFICNATRVPVEPWAAKFADAQVDRTVTTACSGAAD
ncbi:MAG TPA: carboxymuconolactone decarboxylase family protein [Dehalococcoidia bacterium]|jgi:alkylhydroperoxidase family enzyme